MRCLCGCGKATRTESWKGNQTRYLRGHNKRGWVPSSANRQATSRRHDLECVPADPIKRLIEQHGFKVVAKAAGCSYERIRVLYYTQSRLRRRTAERILRGLAGLPREPSWAERLKTTRAEMAERRRKYPRRSA